MKKKFWQIKDGSYQIDKKAFELARVFLKYYRKYTNKKLFRLSSGIGTKSVKDTKWWNCFLTIIERYGFMEEWNENDFIKFQFEEFGIILPFNLLRKDVWTAYVEHLHRGKVDSDLSIAKSLLSAFNKIKKWSKESSFTGANYEEFFKNEKNLFFISRGEFSEYFLSISKSFLKYYSNLTKDKRDGIVIKENLEKARRAVFSRKRIKNKLKRVLGDEFV